MPQELDAGVHEQAAMQVPRAAAADVESDDASEDGREQTSEQRRGLGLGKAGGAGAAPAGARGSNAARTHRHECGGSRTRSRQQQ